MPHRLLLPTAAAVLAAATWLTACGQDPASPVATATPTASDATALPGGLVLAAAPEGAVPIAELKATAQEGDLVVARVIVRGRMAPLVDGHAVATVVDASVDNPCAAGDDHCPTPWDYCCTPAEALQPQLATVQVVGDDGRVLPLGLADLAPPLATLTVRGTVGPRPNAGVLTIQADGIHVDTATP